MKNRVTFRHCRGGFTLVELLVVITIIAILALLASTVAGNMRKKGDATAATANMRQLGSLLLAYGSENGGELPLNIGPSGETWAKVGGPGYEQVWYNALPRVSGARPASDYVTDKAAFYEKGSLFYVPAAKYSANVDTLASPHFGISMNLKLRQSDGMTPLQQMAAPDKTIIFLESGVPGEPKYLSGQSTYNGQATAFATRFIARYEDKKKGLFGFADGHVAMTPGEEAVSPSGKAYSPQINETDASYPGKVLWTADPTLDANAAN